MSNRSRATAETLMRHVLSNTRFYAYLQRGRSFFDYWSWRSNAKGVAPPSQVKHRTIRLYARKFGLKILVETGTFMGHTVETLIHDFARIASIELDPALFEAARRKFLPYPHIQIVRGDSTDMLPRILQELNEPALFWLDGHFSAGVTARGPKETPVLEEVKAILAHDNADHVVLVDDARLFGQGDYPSIETLQSLLSSNKNGWRLSVKDDIIRMHRANLKRRHERSVLSVLTSLKRSADSNVRP